MVSCAGKTRFPLVRMAYTDNPERAKLLLTAIRMAFISLLLFLIFGGMVHAIVLAFGG